MTATIHVYHGSVPSFIHSQASGKEAYAISAFGKMDIVQPSDISSKQPTGLK